MKERKIVEEKYDELIQIFGSSNHQDIIKAMELLNENNILYFQKESDVGIHKTYCYPYKKNFVVEKDYDMAIKLIEPITKVEQENIDDSFELSENIDEIDNDDSDNKEEKNIYRKVMVYGVFGIVLICIILMIIKSCI